MSVHEKFTEVLQYQQYQPWIKYYGCKNKGNDQKLNKLLVIRQILLLERKWEMYRDQYGELLD